MAIIMRQSISAPAKQLTGMMTKRMTSQIPAVPVRVIVLWAGLVVLQCCNAATLSYGGGFMKLKSVADGKLTVTVFVGIWGYWVYLVFFRRDG